MRGAGLGLIGLALAGCCWAWVAAEGAQSQAPFTEAGCQVVEGAITRGPVTRRRLALVFTGHEFAEGGETILEELGRRGGKASFFLTGAFLANPEFEGLIRQIVAQGHYLGPHSDRHLLYCDWGPEKRRLVSRETFEADLLANVEKVARFTTEKPLYFLPPYEHYDEEVARWTVEAGMRLVNLTRGTRSSADYTLDDAENYVGSDEILASILRREREDPQGLNGYLLLMHIGAGPGRTDKFAARVGELLGYLQGRGYELVRVDKLLGVEAKP